ncbi:MAG TPA: F0F1 ATP synthase subunit epsilon [Streptosporangiaceae bacterium]|nr:F0F1 ATP synthase subunit epsilon [Streptosporangiaceae bacterium]
MTLQVKLVVPEGEVWSGHATRVVAKTLEGDVGILTGHTPVLGVISAGSVVRILPVDAAGDAWIHAAVGGGFLSVADNRVSILARQAILGGDVDKASARADLEVAQASQSAESAEASYLRAQLRAAGDEA